MGSLLSLYFLHPFKTWLTNKTQRFYSRYELTNPTKTPPPPFVFSLLSVILLHLHYTLQSPSPLFPIPFSLCYYPPVLMLPCLLIPCPPLSSPSVTTPVLMLPCLLFPCYYPLFLCYSVFSYSVTSYSVSPVPPPCRVKNVYLSYPQGPLLCPRQGLSSMQNMPFLPLEDALLACRTCPSWRHVFKSLIVRSLR